jgi:hypothetical protein
MKTEMVTTTGTVLSTANEELTKTRVALNRLHIAENDIEEQGRILTLSKEISRADRQMLTERRQAIANSLRGCGMSVAARDKAAAAISGMFRDGWPLYKMDNPKIVVAAYIHGLQDYPVWAVESVCNALAKGSVEDVRPDFPPSTARIAQLCEVKIEDLRDQKQRFLRVLSIKEIRTAPMTGEQREAARLRHEKWKAEHQEPQRLSVEEQARLDDRTQETIAANERSILREYAAHGREPVRDSTGRLVTLSLVRMLGLNPNSKAEMDR